MNDAAVKQLKAYIDKATEEICNLRLDSDRYASECKTKIIDLSHEIGHLERILALHNQEEEKKEKENDYE